MKSLLRFGPLFALTLLPTLLRAASNPAVWAAADDARVSAMT